MQIIETTAKPIVVKVVIDKHAAIAAGQDRWGEFSVVVKASELTDEERQALAWVGDDALPARVYNGDEPRPPALPDASEASVRAALAHAAQLRRYREQKEAAFKAEQESWVQRILGLDPKRLVVRPHGFGSWELASQWALEFDGKRPPHEIASRLFDRPELRQLLDAARQIRDERNAALRAEEAVAKAKREAEAEERERAKEAEERERKAMLEAVLRHVSPGNAVARYEAGVLSEQDLTAIVRDAVFEPLAGFEPAFTINARVAAKISGQGTEPSDVENIVKSEAPTLSAERFDQLLAIKEAAGRISWPVPTEHACLVEVGHEAVYWYLRGEEQDDEDEARDTSAYRASVSVTCGPVKLSRRYVLT